MIQNTVHSDLTGKAKFEISPNCLENWDRPQFKSSIKKRERQREDETRKQPLTKYQVIMATYDIPCKLYLIHFNIIKFSLFFFNNKNTKVNNGSK